MGHAAIPVYKPVEARVVRPVVPRAGSRWRGGLLVEYRGAQLFLLMPGSLARWFSEGERVELRLLEEPEAVDENGYLVVPRDTYELWRLYSEPGGPVERVLVWPPWRREERLERTNVLGQRVYDYVVVAREATTEQDFKEIVGLEQYHYASKEEVVAIWKCPICGEMVESNVEPICEKDGVPMKLQEIRGSLPSSRFLVLELARREPYEPRIVGYVRVDTPIPLMHRRRVVDGKIDKDPMIRERVCGYDWFHPTFWPVALARRRELLARYRELLKYYTPKVARAKLGEEIADIALKIANTRAARIARVVIHPDYRGDGLGILAVRMAVEWIRERRVPEMRRKKYIVETIAQMARYNPFFEKAGFRYMWDTYSGRPVLMYPLTEEAERCIQRFLETDEEARRHGGRLFRPRYGRVEPLPSPVKLVNVTKMYSSLLDLERLPPSLQEVLRAFGVEKRLVERYVLRDVSVEIEPGEIVAVVGASGAGKTTLLRIIIGGLIPSKAEEDPRYRPDKGHVEFKGFEDDPARHVAYMLPGEEEPSFGDETLLEHVAAKIGDPAAAVEVLNAVGLSDAVYYRARFDELSTGQKERAKLASLLATKPSIMIIDEFTAHLDVLTAMRVARKLASLARRAGITLVVSTNRPEVLKALAPSKLLLVGYGRVAVLEETGSGA